MLMLAALSCTTESRPTAEPASTSGPTTSVERADGDEPIESTGSHGLDLISVEDPSAFTCLLDLGRGEAEIFDQRTDTLAVHPDAFLYVAHYDDGTSIDFRLHPEFETAAAAREEVDRYITPLGQLPTMLRSGIERIAILKGDETAQGDGDGEGIHIHSGNAEQRITDLRLEETLFHESIHTSLDDLYINTPGWKQAQQADGAFLTSYARANPNREDFAETALYAYALTYHRDRIPDAAAQAWQARIPARLEFFEAIFPAGGSIFATTETHSDCENS